MKNGNKKNLGYIILAVFSTLACVLFYILFLFNTELLPLITKHRFASEWIYVVIAAIPLLLVLGIYFSDKISEINFGKDGLGVKLGNNLPPSLIESISLNEQVSRNYFMKGSRGELDEIIKTIGQRTILPTFLIVPLDELNIEFKVMRQYIYKLSEVAPIRYIIFVGRNNQYLGFATFEKFKSLFPRFALEIFLDDLRDPRVERADLPLIFGNINSQEISEYLSRLVNAQWNQGRNRQNNNENSRVRSTDIGKLGASDNKVKISSSPVNVYWLLVESELEGIPVIDDDGKFIGVVTKDRISQVVILQLLQKSNKAETK